MTELFTRNLQIIKSRWPSAAKIIAAQQVSRLDAVMLTGRERTIRVNGIQLSSRHDPQAETRLYLSTLSQEAKSVTVYGVGMGNVPAALTEDVNISSATIAIMNLEIFGLLLKHSDQSLWLQHPKINLELHPDQNHIARNYIALPGDIELCSKENARLKDLLAIKNNEPFNNKYYQASDPEILRRIIENKSSISKDHDIKELKKYLHSHEAIVVGSGPSLEEHYDDLRRRQQRQNCPLILCANSALNALQNHGIQPDIVMCIDANVRHEYLPLDQTADIALVYFPRISPEIIAGWKGARYSAYGHNALYNNIAREIPKTRLFNNGSVIHPAIDLAVFLGCEDITLLGCDFCYSKNKSHVFWDNYKSSNGPPPSQSWLSERPSKGQAASHWVLNGHGDRIPTNLSWQGFLRSLESYIVNHPQIRFSQASLSGAKIKGCQYREL